MDINYQDIELGALGQKLPIGIWTPQGQRLQEFFIRRYVGKYDVALGELEDMYSEHPDKHTKILNQFLPQVIETIGGYEMLDLAILLTERNLPKLIESMYLADVLYLILRIRLLAQGKDIPLSGKCPCPEEAEIQGGKNTAPHDLNTMNIRILPDNEPRPIYTIPLQQSIEFANEAIAQIQLEPLRFGHLLNLRDESLPLDIHLLQLSSSPCLSAQLYRQLCPDDIDNLRNSVKKINFGPEKSIFMDCPMCGYDWLIPLEHGQGYEDFYINLMKAPRESDEVGATSSYFNRISKFLCFGDQAPCSSLKEVLELTSGERDWWVKDLSETYERQQKEMEKSRKK
ncbi:hypothetical protein FD723_39915 (plasmid) [Nostoc sp. C052]|uniref:hypothetical protein n=1 Tax=Nostoc sp. C052 TaxID=2576902 RepID=UPI0015C3A059|nr:hypothetical protein [Nostoc sp. C052]QLE46380.1 hypothetical protein FD723_39915 [Nostoc sp. C052]